MMRWMIVSVALAWTLQAGLAAETPPNFVILFADDMGYGDLGCYGHPTIQTPNLDRMAIEGMRLTQFYVGAPVCTPSRAALMTGRLPVRSGMCGGRHSVLIPRSSGGLPDSELTLAQALKARGYATACVGKWHLGSQPKYLPTRRGFDSYFGIPYSNDMNPSPLLRNEQVIEEPAVQETLTRRYTDEALKFIRANQDRPFFLYLAYTFPHVPLHASDEFRDTSRRGLYGDVVEEVDSSCGEVLNALRKLKLADNTLVVFSSDNGPWLIKNQNGGSAGLLREGKGSTWEGGMREPCIFWWPGHVKPAIRLDVASTMDILPTFISLAGGEPPKDRLLDGQNISSFLLKGEPLPDRPYFYYRRCELFAARKGPWKIHLATQGGYGDNKVMQHNPPLLFQLEQDPSERFDVAAQHPEIVADLLKEIERHRQTVTSAPSQLDMPDTRPAY